MILGRISYWACCVAPAPKPSKKKKEIIEEEKKEKKKAKKEKKEKKSKEANRHSLPVGFQVNPENTVVTSTDADNQKYDGGNGISTNGPAGDGFVVSQQPNHGEIETDNVVLSIADEIKAIL